jgi:serine protease Do
MYSSKTGYNENTQNGAAGFHEQRPEPPQQRVENQKIEQPKPKTENNGSSVPPQKKSMSMGVKALILCAAAVVFGVIAAVAFQVTKYSIDNIRNSKLDVVELDDDTEESKADADTEDDKDDSEDVTVTTSTSSVDTVYDVSTVAEDVMPSIVSITGTYMITYDYWFSSYQQEASGAGSGIIIGMDDDNLFIATNYHVVEDAKELSVSFIDDETATATVKGYDEDNDVAVVTVALSDISDSTMDAIKPITMGDSDSLKVGEPCVAIGNALGYGQSVTVGYISALNREITTDAGATVKVVQTDAAINPGNSGGALVNMNGELIGINTAKLVDSEVEGMGYALPITDISDIINDLINNDQQPSNNDNDDIGGQSSVSGRAYLGITGATITTEYANSFDMPEGVYIRAVSNNSPAQDAGLTAGDIITALDGEEITDITQLQNVLGNYQPGDEVEIEYYRNTNGDYEKSTTTVTLGSRSDS